MSPYEYEKATLSIIFMFPSGNALIPQRICAELEPDKFGSKEHGYIYSAIKAIVLRNEVPNIVNVSSELGDKLVDCGGIEYLDSLQNFLGSIGITHYDGFESYICVVDSAGRLRHLGLVIEKYSRLYEDFETLVSKTKDVEAFLSDFMTEIQDGVGSIKTSYEHISVAADEERRYLEQSERGLVSNLIPTGWPNLEKYGIPRPSSIGVIVGLSSIGKTQFALQIGYGAARYLYEHGEEGVISINSLETKKRLLLRRLACMRAGVNSREIDQGTLSVKDMRRYYKSVEYIEQLPIVIDDNPNVTSSQLTWQAIAQNLQQKRVLGISDYIELFKDTAATEELRVSGIIRNLRSISWRTNSCELAISQVNGRVLKIPSKIGGLGNARYSGSISHTVDWGAEILNYPQMEKRQIRAIPADGKDTSFAYFLLEKNKEGPLGEEPFEWTAEFTRFRDISLPIGQIYEDYSQEYDF